MFSRPPYYNEWKAANENTAEKDFEEGRKTLSHYEKIVSKPLPRCILSYLTFSPNSNTQAARRNPCFDFWTGSIQLRRLVCFLGVGGWAGNPQERVPGSRMGGVEERMTRS